MISGVPVHGFVLSGGKSERMGRDKALVHFLGRPLARIQVEKLALFCSRVSLVAKPGVDRPDLADAEIFLDTSPEQAALSGITRALEVASEKWVLILAVDIPLVAPTFLSGLVQLAALEGGGPIAPVDSGWVQPLCSVWPRTALSAVAASMSRGAYSVLGALLESRGRILGEDETAALEGFFPGSLANVNDPGELARAETLARERGWVPG